MTDSSFALLRDIGTLQINPQEQIRFSIDAYRGYRYVSVRRYVTLQDGFSGPTREGITLTPEIVRALVPLLLALPQEAAQLKPGPVGKFAKRPGICVVVAIVSFKGERGLDFSLQTQEKTSKSPGLCLPLTKWKDIRQLFADTLAALEEVPEADF